MNKKKWLFYVLCDSNTFVIKYKLLQYKLLKLLYIVSLQPSYDVHHSKNCRMQYFSVHVLMADAHKPKYFFIKYKALYTCRFNIQGAGDILQALYIPVLWLILCSLLLFLSFNRNKYTILQINIKINVKLQLIWSWF